jgi:hypothetical protein
MPGVFPDHKFTPEKAVALRAWLLDQPDPEGDDDPPLSEFDRLLAIMEEAAVSLPEESRKALARAWGATYRIACLMAAEEILPKLVDEMFKDLNQRPGENYMLYAANHVGFICASV